MPRSGRVCSRRMLLFFFFNDTATTEIYTLSLHDALPICFAPVQLGVLDKTDVGGGACEKRTAEQGDILRSEEHTSELQSLAYLVCRLLLEKKKTHPRRLLTVA